MKKIHNHIWYVRIIVILFLLICLLIFHLVSQVVHHNGKSTTITIAIMLDDKVQDYNSNYYKNWLEMQSGYQIRFVYIQPSYYREYIQAMLKAREGTIDALFLPADNKILTQKEFKSYVKAGYFADIMEYLSPESNLQKLFDLYQEDYLMEKMMDQEKKIYYMPHMNTSRKKRNFQSLWINVGWLKTLNLNVPETTNDLYQVLNSFKESDPNGNGIRDEVPLIGCEEEYSYQSYNYLLNAFIPNDPVRGRFYYNNSNKLVCAPEKVQFRKGLEYCRMLYQKDLLVKESFMFTKRQVQELINDPANLVGAFTSQSIADLVYANSPDVIARYIQVPPISGPDGEKNAIMLDLEPNYGGVIPANSSHKYEAFQIMDLMLSREASLIAEFGEENVDWQFSQISDLSTYGTKAKITTIHYLPDKVQNKHFMGAGPQMIDENYIDGVTWNGNSSDVEYIDSRAVMGYEPYYLVNKKDGNQKQSKEYIDFVDQRITDFITGALEIEDNDNWNSFLIELRRLRTNRE